MVKERNTSTDVMKLVLSFFVVGLHLHLFEDINLKISYFFNLAFSNIKVGFDMLFSFILLCPLLFAFVKKLKVDSSMKNIALISSSVYFIHPYVFKVLMYYSQFSSVFLFLFTILVSCILALPLIRINKFVKIL